MDPYFFALLVLSFICITWLSFPLLSAFDFFFFPKTLSLHQPRPRPLPLSFPPACCSFLNLWISEHHFLDFSTPQGDILIPALLFFHLISSLLSESPRQDVRWQCGLWRLGWGGCGVCVCVCWGRWRGWRWGYSTASTSSKKRGWRVSCHSKSNPTDDHRRRAATPSSLLGSKL